MISPIPLKDACDLQSLLASNGLAGKCISAGRMVIVEINQPLEGLTVELSDLLKEQSGTTRISILRTVESCVRRYPDGKTKMDLLFHSREDATTFLDVARACASYS